MPPSVASSGCAGSRESHWPRPPSARWSAPRVIPASTVAVKSPGSCSRRRFSRFSARTRPKRWGGLPMPILVPPPHGATGISDSAAARRTAATSSLVPGSTTASGVRPSTTYGPQSAPVSRWAGPTMPRSASNILLEALGEALLFDGMWAVGGPTIAAGLARREDLAGVAEVARVEGIAQAPHVVEIALGEDEGHVVHLLEADAMLARDGAAHVRADLQDLAARRHHARLFAGNARVVEDVRVEVAVARVEDVAHAEPVRRRDLVDAPEHFGQPRARNDAVHDHVGGGDVAVGAERALAPLPEQLALLLVARRAHLARAAVAARGHHALGLRFPPLAEPVQLDQERSGGIPW